MRITPAYHVVKGLHRGRHTPRTAPDSRAKWRILRLCLLPQRLPMEVHMLLLLMLLL